MKLFLSFFLAITVNFGFADTGIFESYIFLRTDTDQYFNATASSSFQDFHGHNFGSFNSTETFILKGGEIKTWKNNGGDVTGGALRYRIYPTGSAAGNFNSISLPFAENLGGNGDQKWATQSETINILDGLADGDYNIEIYFEAFTNEVTRYHNNGGSNYIATFTVDSSLQIGNVTVSPANPTRTEPITITLDATGTALQDSTNIYLHSGLGTDAPGSIGFNYTVGNWGQDDGVGEMTSIGTNLWEITLNNIDTYYNVLQNEDVFGLNFLFRNAYGNAKEDNAGANYHVDVQPGNYFLLNSPEYSPFFTEINQSFEIDATSDPSTSWTLYTVDSDGNNPTTITTQTGTNFNYSHTLSDTNQHYFRLEANYGSEIKFKNFEAKAYNPPAQATMPAGAQKGVNQDFPNVGEVTFVLHAPTSTTYNYYDSNNCGGTTSVATTPAKEVIYLIGDFNNWAVNDDYKLNVDGDYWWITLNPSTDFPAPLADEYVYQYLIDGQIRIGDPYGHKISDFDDQYISNDIYPNLIPYPAEAEGRATVLELNPEVYTWQSPDFQRQYERDDLNVYELHFRDFTEEGTYKAATEKLDYLAEMGVNTIHVMPVSEFEGNNSWGYNPNYYFAADKAYGTPNDLKEFIDQAHLRGIAVVNDLVLNHAFYSNPNAMMYWDEDNNRPATYNPWFNAEHKAVYDQAGHWGADWNHASEHTQQMMDDILRYWIEEFKFDGFRFDFTKGFTQADPDPSDPWASSYDVCRIEILKRMVNEMWAIDNSPIEHYAIFEHLANDDEDRELANNGILMWSGAGPQHDWVTMAEGNGTTSFWGSVYSSRGFNNPNYMSYMESHDEERVGFKVSNYGAGNDGTTDYLSDRLKLVAAFNLFLPGPRMVWQFGELGYDISIDFNGRTGDKPSAWELGYDQDAERQEIYNYYAHIFNFRNMFDLYTPISSVDYGNIGSTTDWTRIMRLTDNNGTYVIPIGNFQPNTDNSVSPNYPVTGTWYKYNGDPSIDGTPFNVSSSSEQFTLFADDPTYILSNKDILPPVFNVENSTIETDYCQFALSDAQDITIGNWIEGSTENGKVADNSGTVNIELLEINGTETTATSLTDFQPNTGENTFLWKATDASGNESEFLQTITINRGECHKPGLTGAALDSGVLISTLNRNSDNQTTTKKNGLLVLESKAKGFIITKIPEGETTDIIANPVEGMIVLDENENCLKLYDGNTWGCIQQKAVPN